ncbi:S-adenosyl-L-methionine-dependent methyltransferase [Rhodotorula diobovata]|uniref:S-adenosyl-L-methionine-dependent methyltransferase n=1 Tax=Rhodotorula diobovata TaxID=5288 RepID=A0A5C5FMA8_9BASI|nr:S-adenosyl-L-methionine-dependent methyltransferase [Rhodotorula diobovata]
MVSAWLAFLAGLVAAYLVPLACASLLARRPSSSSSHELYSSTADDALLLNLEPPATRWFNMGYWPRTQLSSSSSSSFAAAAADLCRLVARAAHLGPNQRICEVGYGSGDSTLLLEREFRPARYLGLTSLASQHATAGESPFLRAQAAGLPTDRIQLRHGDAATDLASEPADSFDAVLAVDCAYHFNTRVAFLSHAQRILRPGGSLALTDLLLAAPPPPSSSSLLSSLITPLLLRTLLLVARAPWHNFVQPATYRAELVAAGFDPASIELRDVSDAVWPGFCHFQCHPNPERTDTLG